MTVEMDIHGSQKMKEGPSVLVVDDESSIRRLLGVLLEGSGYRVMLAANGVEARAAMEKEEVALILSDVNLRGESGTTMVRDLLRQSPHAVALMMSGDVEPERIPRVPDERIIGYVVKPFDAKDVTKRIAEALCGRCVGGTPTYGEETFPRQWRREITNA